MSSDIQIIDSWTDPGLPRRRTYESSPRFTTIAGMEAGRRWKINGQRIDRPHWNYRRNQFEGTTHKGGQAWSHPYDADLLYWVASQVRGWCPPNQGRRLHELAREAPGEIVEVGSAFGLSTVWIGWGIRESRDPGRSLHCVDTWQHLDTHKGSDGTPTGKSSEPEFQSNIKYAGLNNHICQHLRFSADAARQWPDQSIGMIYIDGHHTYEAVKTDHLGWLPHLRPGAIVAFDDCTPNWPGVLRYQREILAAGTHRLLDRVDNMLVWRYQP